ncbi:MAG: EAL domain-containing protein [Methylococcaceae bacterium]|nr:EAL domain-containing protein [Methylococcaceae bacterium]
MMATYNLGLVGLSIAIAMLASYVAISQAKRWWSTSAGRVRNWGILGAAAAMSCGVWTMHFIGILAYHFSMPIHWDGPISGLSFLCAFLGTGGAFLLAQRQAIYPLILGSFFMAMGIVAMHYTGIYAMRMNPPIIHDATTVVLSVLIAQAGSLLGLWLAFRSSSLDSRWRVWGASGVMGLAVSGIHYLAMAGIRYDVNARSMVTPTGVSQDGLAALLASGSFLVLLLSLFLSIGKPLFSLWRMTALVLLGEIAVMVLLERVWPHDESLVWQASVADGILLTALLFPVLWRLHRDSHSLSYERARASTALASIGEGVILTDSIGVVEYLNSVAEDLIGWKLEEARGRKLDEVFHIVDEDTEFPLHSPVEACIRENRVIEPDSPIVLIKRNGCRCGIESSAAPIHDENGRAAGAVLVFRDVMAKRKVDDELNLSASVFSHAAEGILITDRDGRILRVNKAFYSITGYTANEVGELRTHILCSGKQDQSFYDGLWEQIELAGEWQGELGNQRKNGELFTEWLSIRVIHNERGEISNYVGIFSDISERVRDQEYIYQLAYYDTLTGLANRGLLVVNLEMAISLAKRHQQAVALLFIDIDRFKLINDSLGHAIGDLLLQNVAKEISACIRDGDTVARFGGDEFVICLPEMPGDREEAVSATASVAEQIQRRLSQPHILHGQEVAITPSMGVAVYPWDGENPNDLIKHADVAMYHAKTLGRDNFQMFSGEMLSADSERLQIQSGLRKALENREFAVHYQAQLDLSTGRIVGAEALLRWNSPELGRVSPAKFIPVAEDTSLILPIGDWVLHQVCQDWKDWKERIIFTGGLPRIAVNFSPRQFVQPNFVEKIMSELKKSNVDPHFIEVEITEAILMHNTELALSSLKRLRDHGIRIAVDDFGVGYSSLSYLKKFPLDVLKIDQSFIREVVTSDSDAKIVRAIIAMGRSLNLTVLAEGVETMEQLAFLKKAGCQEVQGYLLSRPIRENEFAELLRRGGKDRPVKARSA